MFKYLDNYSNATAYFTDALIIHPQFGECRNELDSLKDQIMKTKVLIARKGKLKPKKVAMLMKNLKEKISSQNPKNTKKFVE